MILTSKEILLILRKLNQRVVVPASKDFPYEVVCESRTGYSEDRETSQLQAKLSIMLEVAGKAGR